MRIERLPFTVYDVLGYLIPGLVLFGFIVLSTHPLPILWGIWTNGSSSISILSGSVIVVGAVVVAYVAGHIVSLAASETVEKLITHTIGYPSIYLTSSAPYSPIDGKEDSEVVYNAVSKISSENCKYLYVVLFSRIFLLPLYIILMAMNLMRMLHHLVKRMDANFLELLNARFVYVFGQDRSALSGRSWFLLVENFVIHHCATASLRMYNYLTLYGFCRNMCLATYLGTLLLIWRYFQSGYSAHLTIFIAISFTSSAFMLFGFLKYFRRYSHEALLNFVVMKIPSIVEEKL